MTLRCPKCGSRRILFQSTTNGTAVGSTDQRYLCKDCDYRGTFILDDAFKETDDAVIRDLKKIEADVGEKKYYELLSPNLSKTLLHLVLFVVLFQFVSIGLLLALDSSFNIALGLGAVVTLLFYIIIYIFHKQNEHSKALNNT